MSAPAPTRRAFVAGAGALVLGLVGGGAARAYGSGGELLRPPGALPGPEFLARCIRCERCVSACPTDVLHPLGIEAGIGAARTPSVSFAQGRCTFCDQCRIVCPTGAIVPFDPFSPDERRIGAAVVHEGLCLAFKEAGSCGICRDACEYGAISFDGQRRPVVDASVCNGCGECERICPANVATSFTGSFVRGIEVAPAGAPASEGGR